MTRTSRSITMLKSVFFHGKTARIHHLWNYGAIKPVIYNGYHHSADSFSLPENVRLKFSKLSGGSVDLTKDEQSGIAQITLNQPQYKNAFSGKMMLDLFDAINELENWKSGKGLLMAGAANTFCSGGDLKAVTNMTDSGEEMSSLMQNALTKLSRLPLISVALIEGVALGGGAELTTACDFRIMAPKAKIGFVQVHMGVITGWGGGTRLVKLIGHTSALDLFSTGKIINSSTALALGFVDHVVKDGENAIEAAKEWLSKRCRGHSSVTRSIKSMVSHAGTEDVQSSLNHERKLFSKLWGGPLFLEALKKNIKHKS
ncbi:ethylmalonyl-CoA decarboxylase isoform X1 [Octopus bimaculoides]|nr:ethylmalonyl-CoA decarboxylase isoform X1 [Octopus bimaculoides]